MDETLNNIIFAIFGAMLFMLRIYCNLVDQLLTKALTQFKCFLHCTCFKFVPLLLVFNLQHDTQIL